MGLIGRGWKPCEGWSRPVLIGRGLAHNTFVARIHCVTLSTQPKPAPREVSGGVGVCSVGWCSLNIVVGGCGGGVTPGPIPNPEAKPSSADGTALARVWESRSPPTFNVKTEWAPASRRGPTFVLPIISERTDSGRAISASCPPGHSAVHSCSVTLAPPSAGSARSEHVARNGPCGDEEERR